MSSHRYISVKFYECEKEYLYKVHARAPIVPGDFVIVQTNNDEEPFKVVKVARLHSTDLNDYIKKSFTGKIKTIAASPPELRLGSKLESEII
mgnify:CR=1 FL=1